jgi:hypothetical protein
MSAMGRPWPNSVCGRRIRGSHRHESRRTADRRWRYAVSVITWRLNGRHVIAEAVAKIPHRTSPVPVNLTEDCETFFDETFRVETAKGSFR